MTDEHTDKTARHSNGAGADIGNELSELRIGAIVWFLIGLTAATVVVFLLMAGLFHALNSGEQRKEGKASPLAGERQKLPPEPRLQLAPSSVEQIENKQPPNLKQDNPLQEMKRLREEEDSKLNSYGWADEKAGVVRIPIDEAKKLLLEKGIPTRK